MNCSSCDFNKNIYKHIPPNFNPGIRKWCGVPQEQHIVTGLDTPFYSYNPMNTPAENKLQNSCIYGSPIPIIENNIEGFGNFGNIGLIEILIIAIIVIVIWNFLKQYRY